MYEVLGGKSKHGTLEQRFKGLEVSAQLMWSDSGLNLQVWQLEDTDFELFKNKDRKRMPGWWYCVEGSYMGPVTSRYCINGHYIKAWDGYHREEHERENRLLPASDRWLHPRKYSNLLKYMLEEIGISSQRNIAVLAFDLARQNVISLAELFKRYQPAHEQLLNEREGVK